MLTLREGLVSNCKDFSYPSVSGPYKNRSPNDQFKSTASLSFPYLQVRFKVTPSTYENIQIIKSNLSLLVARPTFCNSPWELKKNGRKQKKTIHPFSSSLLDHYLHNMTFLYTNWWHLQTAWRQAISGIWHICMHWTKQIQIIQWWKCSKLGVIN